MSAGALLELIKTNRNVQGFDFSTAYGDKKGRLTPFEKNKLLYGMIETGIRHTWCEIVVEDLTLTELTDPYDILLFAMERRYEISLINTIIRKRKPITEYKYLWYAVNGFQVLEYDEGLEYVKSLIEIGGATVTITILERALQYDDERIFDYLLTKFKGPIPYPMFLKTLHREDSLALYDRLDRDTIDKNYIMWRILSPYVRPSVIAWVTRLIHDGVQPTARNLFRSFQSNCGPDVVNLLLNNMDMGIERFVIYDDVGYMGDEIYREMAKAMIRLNRIPKKMGPKFKEVFDDEKARSELLALGHGRGAKGADSDANVLGPELLHRVSLFLRPPKG